MDRFAMTTIGQSSCLLRACQVESCWSDLIRSMLLSPTASSIIVHKEHCHNTVPDVASKVQTRFRDSRFGIPLIARLGLGPTNLSPPVKWQTSILGCVPPFSIIYLSPCVVGVIYPFVCSLLDSRCLTPLARFGLRFEAKGIWIVFRGLLICGSYWFDPVIRR